MLLPEGIGYLVLSAMANVPWVQVGGAAAGTGLHWAGTRTTAVPVW